MRNLTLSKVLVQLKTADKDPFEDLFRQHGHECVRYLKERYNCPKMLAEDIMMDSMICYRDKYLSGEPLEVSNLKAYLLTTCRNMWFKYYARKNREWSKERELYHYFYEYREETDPDIPMLKEERHTLELELSRKKIKCVEKALGQLDKKCQEIIHASCIQNLSMKEVAKKMGFANANVAKTTKCRCYKKWRNKFKEHTATFAV